MKRLTKTRKAAGLVEYGLIVGLISVLGIGAVSQLGSQTKETYETVTSVLVETGQDQGNGVGVPQVPLVPEDPLIPAPVVHDGDCYDAANIGMVGLFGWTGDCADMLIVSEAMLRSAASTDPFVGGDGSYQLVGPDGVSYTFAESMHNVFTGQVTNINNLFRMMPDFNGDIGYWDTSNVTNMFAMFYLATSFNQDIGAWEMSSVTRTASMFYIAEAFNQDIGGWNVSNVGDFALMFANTSFNQDISGWDTTSATSMMGMFQQTSAFNQDIGEWSVPNAMGSQRFDQMFFQAAAFNQDISGWCVSAVFMEPSMFRLGSPLTAPNRPQWGQACT